jgi:uncharacterized protein
MKYTAIKFLFLVLILKSSFSIAQINLYRNVLSNGKTLREYKEAQDNKTEIQAAFSGLFLMYKTFFSSQDMASCTFTPSCSEFGIISVKKYGMFKGGIMTMDRLSRCNGLSPTKYNIDKKTLLLKDEPWISKEVPLLQQEF